MAKKQSIPTTRKIFSMIDGLELASMHLYTRTQKREKKKKGKDKKKLWHQKKIFSMKTIYQLNHCQQRHDRDNETEKINRIKNMLQCKF